MKNFLILFLSFFLAGCSTKYLVGYHYLGDEEFVIGMVSEKTERLSQPFEENCVQALIKADMDSFKSLFTDKLSKAVPEDGLIKLKEAIQVRYKPYGRYRRLEVLNKPANQLHAELDTATLVNGFKHYDYIEAQYLLYGASNAIVHLYLTEVGEEFRLSGFELHDAGPATGEGKFLIKYLVPETVDKGGLLGTTIIKLPK